MKAWLKGGLIGILVSIILSLIALILPPCCIGGCIGGSPCPNIFLTIIGNFYMISIFIGFAFWAILEFHSTILFYAILFLSSLLFYFLLGVLIGLIVQKIKSKNTKFSFI